MQGSHGLRPLLVDGRPATSDDLETAFLVRGGYKLETGGVDDAVDVIRLAIEDDRVLRNAIQTPALGVDELYEG